VLDSLTDMSGKPTKKNPDSDMRDEYDFSAGVRGKYAKRYAEGTNVVVLEPDVAAKIKSAEEVNRILREHLAGHSKTGAV
jgi:hypothetical protein